MTSITYKLLVNLGISDILITCLCGTVNLFQTHILGKFVFRMSLICQMETGKKANEFILEELQKKPPLVLIYDRPQTFFIS